MAVAVGAGVGAGVNVGMGVRVSVGVGVSVSMGMSAGGYEPGPSHRSQFRTTVPAATLTPQLRPPPQLWVVVCGLDR